MKPPLLIFFIALLLTLPVGAAVMVREETTDIIPIINKAAPVVIDLPLKVNIPLEVQYLPMEVLSADPIRAVKQLIGLEEKDSAISVIVDDTVLAVIPPDSKFVDMQVTRPCLEHQYGTDAWYSCEKRLQ